MKEFMDGLKRWDDFSGKANIREYWMFALISFVIYIVLVISRIGVLLIPLVGLVLLVPSLAVAVRRFNDINKSPLLLLLGLIPIVQLVLIYFLVQPSATIAVVNTGNTPNPAPMPTQTPAPEPAQESAASPDQNANDTGNVQGE